MKDLSTVLTEVLEEQQTHCLISSSEFIADLISSVGKSKYKLPVIHDRNKFSVFKNSQLVFDPRNEPPFQLQKLRLEVSERCKFARTWICSEKYKKASNILSPSCIPESGNEMEAFLWAYSLFLSGEKIRLEAIYEKKKHNNLQFSSVSNKYISLLSSELSKWYSEYQSGGQQSASTPYLLFIYGKVLLSTPEKENGAKILIETWDSLVEIATESWFDDNYYNMLPAHWCSTFIKASLAMKYHLFHEAYLNYTFLFYLFPNSLYLLSKSAVCLYELKKHEHATQLFHLVMKKDPTFLDGMDTFSDMLLVTNSKKDLGYLAHLALKADQFSPITSHIIGNFCSMTLNHEKAISYFGRALRLAPEKSSLYIMMGQEYMEIKEVDLSLKYYLKAGEIDPSNYKAWFGLGQAYQLSKMYCLAETYFRKCTVLQPYQVSCWQALAGCYEHLKKYSFAITCYKRAYSNYTGQQGEYKSAFKLAKLYAKLSLDPHKSFDYGQNKFKHIPQQYKDMFGEPNSFCYEEPDIIVATRGKENLQRKAAKYYDIYLKSSSPLHWRKVEALKFLICFFEKKEIYSNCERYAKMLKNIGADGDEEVNKILEKYITRSGFPES
eukprot:maker-scaffold_11-snap-gene-1.50-mRNA-1 protein AED:0.01 eAED:0.01 QI:0/0/0.5/1/1/1/2/60/607